MCGLRVGSPSRSLCSIVAAVEGLTLLGGGAHQQATGEMSRCHDVKAIPVNVYCRGEEADALKGRANDVPPGEIRRWGCRSAYTWRAHFRGVMTRAYVPSHLPAGRTACLLIYFCSFLCPKEEHSRLAVELEKIEQRMRHL